MKFTTSQRISPTLTRMINKGIRIFFGDTEELLEVQGEGLSKYTQHFAQFFPVPSRFSFFFLHLHFFFFHHHKSYIQKWLSKYPKFKNFLSNKTILDPKIYSLYFVSTNWMTPNIFYIFRVEVYFLRFILWPIISFKLQFYTFSL